MKKVLRVVLALLISFCIGVAFATEECLHQNTKEVVGKYQPEYIIVGVSAFFVAILLGLFWDKICKRK